MENICEEIIDIAQKCCADGLLPGNSGLAGNISFFDRETGRMAITPTSLAYNSMKPADIAFISLDGEHLAGGRPSSEWPMHGAIYRAWPDIRAIIHTHSPYATAFAVSGMAIPPIMIEMVPVLGGAVQIAPFATPGTPAVGENAIPALIDRGAALLANHGAIAIGDTLHRAYIRAACLEEVAKVYSIALSHGNVNFIT